MIVYYIFYGRIASSIKYSTCGFSSIALPLTRWKEWKPVIFLKDIYLIMWSELREVNQYVQQKEDNVIFSNT